MGGEPGDRAHRRELQRGDHRAVGGVPVHAADGGRRGGDQQLVADRHDRLDHVVALGDEGAPGGGRRIVEAGLDDAAAGRVEGGDAEQAVTDHLEPGERVDPGDHHATFVGDQVEQVDIDAGPPHRHRHDQPAAVARERHRRPGGLVGEVGEHRPVGRRIGAEVVPPHRAVVLALVGTDVGDGRVPGVGEAAEVGRPRHRGGPGVGDRVGQVVAGVGVEHPQGAALAPTRGDAIGHEASVERGGVPVEGRGLVAGAIVGVDQDPGVAPLVQRPHDQHGLFVIAPSIEREDLVAGDGRCG